MRSLIQDDQSQIVRMQQQDCGRNQYGVIYFHPT